VREHHTLNQLSFGSATRGKAAFLICATMIGVAGALASTHLEGQAESRNNPSPVFQDDFESGKYARDQEGGRWVGGGSGNVHVGRGGAGGSAFALDLIHRAKPPKGMSSAEQRFTLAKGVPELWLEYDFYLPENFFHRGTGNNKFLALWEEEYGGIAKDGTTTTQLLVEFRPMNDRKRNEGRPGDSYLYVNGRSGKTDKMRRMGSAPNAFTIRERGRWNKVRIHVRLSSTDASEDGVFELAINGQQLISSRRLALPSAASGHYIRRGYFLGWANSGYNEDTHFKVDNVRIYNSNPGW
jgi:hypothetical protein